MLGRVYENVALVRLRGWWERFAFGGGPLLPAHVTATRTNNLVLAAAWCGFARFEGGFLPQAFYLLSLDSLSHRLDQYSVGAS